MGLWNKAKEKYEKAKEKAIVVYEKAKEKTIEVTKKAAKKIEETADKVVKWADKITQNKKIIISTIKEEGSYIKNNTHSVKDNATIISHYINQNSPIFDEIETQYIDIYSDQFIELLDIPFMDADKEKIKSKLNDGKKYLKGTMKNYLNKRVNISDFEFISIIEMKSGKKKEEMVEAFISKVLIESRNFFCKRLKEVLISDHDFIRNHFKNKIEILENGMNASLNDLQNAEALASHDENKQKEEILKSAFVMCQCEYVINKI